MLFTHRLIRLLFAGICCFTMVAASFAQEKIARTEYPPKGGGKGSVVIVISGQTGPSPRQQYAKDLAELGYYTVLIDGNDVFARDKDGSANIRGVIADALASQYAGSSQVAVVGFSLGGASVLAYVMPIKDTVKMAVAYYPGTNWIRSVETTVGRFQMPLLLLAGEKDTYNNCCLIDKARQIEATAKAAGKSFEMVTYPEAEHGFDLTGRNYRRADTQDAWKRTTEMLTKLHPVK